MRPPLLMEVVEPLENMMLIDSLTRTDIEGRQLDGMTSNGTR